MNIKLKLRIIERFNTQADFAQHLKVAESRVSRTIRERQHLTSVEKSRWAEALRCRPEEIFNA
jgi:plasmid maintenance system antidote protein VapI